jgi:hypothetical protein
MRTVERIAEALGFELNWQMVSRDKTLNEGRAGDYFAVRPPAAESLRAGRLTPTTIARQRD